PLHSVPRAGIGPQGGLTGSLHGDAWTELFWHGLERKIDRQRGGYQQYQPYALTAQSSGDHLAPAAEMPTEPLLDAT
ncbi:hypothetical protein AMJ57_05105, partial [Parcubacteria bacterium SG8_24]